MGLHITPPHPRLPVCIALLATVACVLQQELKRLTVLALCVCVCVCATVDLPNGAGTCTHLVLQRQLLLTPVTTSQYFCVETSGGVVELCPGGRSRPVSDANKFECTWFALWRVALRCSFGGCWTCSWLQKWRESRPQEVAHCLVSAACAPMPCAPCRCGPGDAAPVRQGPGRATECALGQAVMPAAHRSTFNIALLATAAAAGHVGVWGREGGGRQVHAGLTALSRTLLHWCCDVRS
jgi:hypothetical protein